MKIFCSALRFYNQYEINSLVYALGVRTSTAHTFNSVFETNESLVGGNLFFS